MFPAPLCPSSGAREYYTSGCCLSYLVLGFQVVGMVWSWGLCVRFAGCCSSPQTGHIILSSTPYRQLENQAPNTTGSNHLYNTLELLMMGIMVRETCWASYKICNKYHLLHLVGILFPHINDDARSKPHKNIQAIWSTNSLHHLLLFVAPKLNATIHFHYFDLFHTINELLFLTHTHTHTQWLFPKWRIYLILITTFCDTSRILRQHTRFTQNTSTYVWIKLFTPKFKIN